MTDRDLVKWPSVNLTDMAQLCEADFLTGEVTYNIRTIRVADKALVVLYQQRTGEEQVLDPKTNTYIGRRKEQGIVIAGTPERPGVFRRKMVRPIPFDAQGEVHDSIRNYYRNQELRQPAFVDFW